MCTNIVGDSVNTNRGLIALFITATKLHDKTQMHKRHTHTNKGTR